MTIHAELIASGLAAPTFAASAPGTPDLLFITERYTGQIRVLDLETNQLSATPFFDLPATEMSTAGEGGLLGLAFHPDYATNGKVFLNFTNEAGDGEVWELTRAPDDPGIADPASARVVMTVDRTAANHVGGWIGFGPDGYLYIASGDSGGGGDPQNAAQNVDDLRGKMLRIDVDGDAFPDDPLRNYAIPEENPFVGVDGADEVFAFGLRNPWRASFDRATGDLYIADVGEAAREEINFLAAGTGAGTNFGWRVLEGTLPTGYPPLDNPPADDPSLTAPIHEYGRADGRTVIGGYVYRGPGGAQGEYFFADFLTHHLWTARVVDGEVVSVEMRDDEVVLSGGTFDRIVSFAEDGHGRLYAIGLDGELFRITPVDSLPTAYLFSALADAEAVVFDPQLNVLTFDAMDIAAGDVRFAQSGGDTRIEVLHGPHAGKDVTLLGIAPFELATSNVTFADGSRLLLGDDSTAPNDDAANSLTGSPGRDLLVGFGGADTLDGGLGDDTYIVTAGDVLLDPGGVDIVVSDVSWTLGVGFEHITLAGTAAINATGNELDNFAAGNAAANVFNLRTGNDTVLAGAGNDRIELSNSGTATYGDDVVDGGAGFDALNFHTGSGARSAVSVDLAAGTARGGGEGGAGSVSFASIERVIGTHEFGDALSGSAVAERLEGRGGNDTLSGLGGNDTLSGGAGEDTFDFASAPGSGNVDVVTDFVSATDKLSFDNAAYDALGPAGNFSAGDARFALGAGFTSGRDASDRIVYDVTTGGLYYDPDGSGAAAASRIATLQGAPALAASDIVVTGESAPPGSTQGSDGNDSLLGTEGDDFLEGLGGNDSIDGFGGNDTLDGGAAVDTMDGGRGDDRYIVTAGDVVRDAGGADTVASDITWTLGAGFEHIHLTGSSAINATGNELGNRAIGNDAANFFNLRAGNDSIEAGDGNDRIDMSRSGSVSYGDDVIDGGTGFDLVSFHTGSGALSAVVVDLAAGSASGGGQGGAGSATLTSIERVIGTNEFGDRLSGSAAAERFEGRGGNDTLSGFGGNDTLVGEAGADTFVFAAAPGSGNVDLLTDFLAGTDELSFDDAVFTALDATGDLAAADARFASGAGFTSGRDATDRIIYNTSTGALYYDADGSASGAAVQVATLQAIPTLTAADIAVI